MMQYTLITKQGRVLTFFIQEVADCYQMAYGGVVITQQILEQEPVVKEGECNESRSQKPIQSSMH